MQLGYIHICRGTNVLHRRSLMCKHWTQEIQVYRPLLATSHWGRLYRPSLGHRLQNPSCALKKAWLYTTGISQPGAIAPAAAVRSAKNQFGSDCPDLPPPTASPFILHQTPVDPPASRKGDWQGWPMGLSLVEVKYWPNSGHLQSTSPYRNLKYLIRLHQIWILKGLHFGGRCMLIGHN